MKPSKELYQPLDQYALCDDGENGAKQARRFVRDGRYFNFSLSNGIIVILALSNIILLALLSVTEKVWQVPHDYARVDLLPTKWSRFDWWTEYSEKNDTEVDVLWDAILPSHGFVAMDTEWAKAKQWPESMRLPSDQSKSVYLLEAYHQLHCVTIIRKTFLELWKGRNLTYSVAHSGHCFDMIRQTIQCNADNTPLYVFGDGTAGDGQLHKCRDWNALRDFATDNTACYRDSAKPIILGDHFGYCDDGNDGVIDAKRANVTVLNVTEAQGL